jgi:paraquat-inducible protein B
MTTAKPEIRSKKSFNAIWIIPLIAVVLGVWMVVHSWMTEGPEIQIAFKTAEGLTAGKTKVKYRNVDMGVVQEVLLTDDFEGVIAKVKLERQALPLLRDETRFWVVTARVGVGNVSGLDTLLSGAYIQLAPGEGKPGRRQYTALETPPLTPTGAHGLRLKLYGEQAGSVSTGDAIVYKGYKVGRIESMAFDADRRVVSYVAFIDAPFHELVDSSVRFYNVSGVSVSAGAEGLQITTGSLDTILLGGVTFGTPEGIQRGEPVEHNTEFRLYNSAEEASDNPFRFGTYYVVRFTQSLKGLLPGAPVEYRGIPVGRVERLMIKDMVLAGESGGHKEFAGQPIPVLIYVEPARMELPDTEVGVSFMRRTIEAGVRRGLRATLENGNLLTGAKYVGIDFFEGTEPAESGTFGEYVTLPTVVGGFDQVLVQVNALLDKFNALPLEGTVANANAAIASLDKVLAELGTMLDSKEAQTLPKDLANTLQSLQKTLNGLTPDSEMYQNLEATLEQLNRTMSNVESLTRTLSGQPNAAVFGSQMPSDLTPEAQP